MADTETLQALRGCKFPSQVISLRLSLYPWTSHDVAREQQALPQSVADDPKRDTVREEYLLQGFYLMFRFKEKK